MKRILILAAVLAAFLMGLFVLKNALNQTNTSTKGAAEATSTASSAQPSISTKSAAEALPAGYEPQTDALQSILKNKIARISVENPSEPFFFEKNGKPAGFNPDFVKLMFAQSEFGGNIEIKPSGVDTYEAVPQQLTEKSGANYVVDMAMDGLTFADNEPNGVVYSIPYIDDFGYALITKKDSTLKSMSDMQGKTIGVLKGDPDVKKYVLKAFPDSKVVGLSDAAINGERAWLSHFINDDTVDAIVYDYPFALSEMEGTNLVFAISKLEGSNIEYKIGVRKEDSALLTYLNSAIGKVRALPEYSNLLKKYFISNQIVTVAATQAEKTITVKQGDTLSSLAISIYGSKSRYTDIQKRNNLPNPNLIYVGQQLVIPK